MLDTKTESKSTSPDIKKVEEFAGQVISDMSACISGLMHLIGHELGFYKAMKNQGYISSKELADNTGTYERYVREWLNNQAAGGYVLYDPQTKKYSLPAEHAFVLADEDSPAFMSAGYYIVGSLWMDREKLAKMFRTGEGFGWHEHNHDLFYGTEAFFRPGYKANLVESWLPTLDGLSERLKLGGRVADVGCGHGISTIIMGEAFPNAEIIGYDYHQESVDIATQKAKERNLKNVSFVKASADNFDNGNYDLICFMDSFHDMGNPLKAAIHSREKLTKTGRLMIVEPLAGDNPEENFNPIGRMYYAASTLICVPNSHSQEGDFCIGAQAGPARTQEILRDAGFTNVRVVQKTVVNIIYEASM